MPTKKYTEIDVSAWNTRHFRDYLTDEHKRRFGINYVPFIGYAAEAGMLGDLIGTKKKPAMYGKATIMAFINACFDEYKPSAQYPGLSFGFMAKFMTRNLQRVEAEANRKATSEQAVKASDNDKLDELEAWL